MLLVACKEDQQKPEAKFVSQNQVMEVSNKIRADRNQSHTQINMAVHHQVKDQKVYVECIVTPNFHFTEKKKAKKHGEGQLYVYLNDQKIDAFTQGAFILKDLPKGKHTVMIKLMHNDQSEYGLSESFDIEI
jgi:hypothetical protein